VGSFLLVGGSSDIGLGLCERLVENQHKVIIVARDETRLKNLNDDSVVKIIGDANNEDLIKEAVVLATESGEGKIDGVAHLVGSLALRPPHAMKLEAFEEVIKINLTSAFVTLSIACKQMLRNGGGRVVFTSSVAGSLGLVNHEAISAAKGGVESMVRSAAATYSRRGIRVNAVAPGLTDTRLSYPITKSENSKKAAVDRIPINRINEAEEIVTTINWLLTDAPDNITGQIFHLDGGMSKVRN
jgi:NAD(P)-dependent dehydrogenase (short-subunit alcohol dehydrogenase family)